MERLLKLTKIDGSPILIGVESIISVEDNTKPGETSRTKIYSRSAMASSYWVTESVEEIYNQYKVK
jgi:hypothetical protein